MQNISGMRHIFISSTFRDMQAERDLVQERVMPGLRQKGSGYGESVDFTDLRWGVDTTEISPEEGAKKVLRVCFDEIDKCDPYMLIFVGARYGWIPTEDTVRQALEQRDGLFDNTDLSQSVTSLEIEYGALASRRRNADKNVVCFRVDEVLSQIDGDYKAIYEETGDLAKEKLDALKKKLSTKYGENIILYSATWNSDSHKFENFVTTDGRPLDEVIAERFEKIFEPDWQVYASLCREEKEISRARALQDKYVSRFVGQEKEVEELLDALENKTNESHVILYKSPIKLDETNDSKSSLMEGFGITSAMSVLSHKLREKGANSIVFYCGRTGETTGIEELLENIVYFLKSAIGHEPEQKPEDFAFKKQYLEYLIREAAPTGKIYIFLDRLTAIAMPSELKNLTFIPQPTEDFKVIITGDASPELDNLHRRDYAEMQLYDINSDTIEKITGDNYKAVQAAILGKKSSVLPLYLNLVNLRLKMLGFEELHDKTSEEDIISVAIKAVEELSDNPYKASLEILKLAIKKLEINEADMLTALNVLAISECGLRIQDLANLMKILGHSFNSVDFLALRKYMSEILVEDPDGFIFFDRMLVQDQIRKEYGEENGAYKEIYQAYGKYMYEIPENDKLFKNMAYITASFTQDYTLGLKILSAAGKGIGKQITSNIRHWLMFERGRFLNNLFDAMCGFGEFVPDEAALDFLAGEFIGGFTLSQLDEMLLQMVFEKLEMVMKVYEWAYAVSKGESDYDIYKKDGASQDKLDQILQYEENMRRTLEGVTLPKNSREAYVTFFRTIADRKKNQNKLDEAEMYANKAAVTVYIENKNDDGRKKRLEDLKNMVRIADSLRVKGMNEEAQDYYIQVIKGLGALLEEYKGQLTFEEIKSINSGEYRAHYGLIILCDTVGRYEDVVKLFSYFAENWNAVNSTDSKSYMRPIWSDVNLYMHNAMMALGKKEEAWTYLETFINEETILYKYDENSTGTGLNLAYSYVKAAEYYKEMGDTKRCAKYYYDAVMMYEPIYKDVNSEVALNDLQETTDALAMALMDADMLSEATIFLDRAANYFMITLDLKKKSAKENNTEVSAELVKKIYNRALSLLKLGAGICKQRGMDDRQIEYLEALIKVSNGYISDTGDTSIIPITDNYYVKITNINHARGKSADNIKYFNMLAEFREKVFSIQPTEENLQSVAEARSTIGMINESLGKYAEQVVALNKEHKVVCELCKRFGAEGYMNNMLAIIKDMKMANRIQYEKVAAGEGKPVILAQCYCIEINVVDKTRSILNTDELDDYLKSRIALFHQLVDLLKEAGYDNLKEEELIVSEIETKLK